MHAIANSPDNSKNSQVGAPLISVRMLGGEGSSFLAGMTAAPGA